ncbi:hypothetical protein [Wolbachia endosymbiont (group A) of Beris morrisii]|uniref:hypothetical protein n=2 Tax=Wolbachia TaxID=953 RepID=UPI0033400513
MKKCLEQPGKGKLAPYDKERFDLKKELARVTRERHFKKSPGQPKRVKYSFIKEHRNCYKIQELCRFLDVSACGYYKWVAKEKNNKELAREELLGDIQKSITTQP